MGELTTSPEDDSQAELVRLADQLSTGIFHAPASETDRTRFLTLLQMAWDRLQETEADQDQDRREKRITRVVFLLQAVLICPPLLDWPPGFEWIMRQLQWELTFRKANRAANQLFWHALERVRKSLKQREGRVYTGRDLSRHRNMRTLMREEGLSKTQAVERLAELEDQALDERAIWKSLQRVRRVDERYGKAKRDEPTSPRGQPLSLFRVTHPGPKRNTSHKGASQKPRRDQGSRRGGHEGSE